MLWCICAATMEVYRNYRFVRNTAYDWINQDPAEKSSQWMHWRKKNRRDVRTVTTDFTCNDSVGCLRISIP
jgi:hypothetical protein